MSASCYLCAKGGHSTLPNTSVGDAVGACKLCGVLACLGHGQRDPGQPAYLCGICLANLLAAASARQIPIAPTKPTPTPPPPGGEEREPSTAAAYLEWAMGINDPRDVIDDWGAQRWMEVRKDADYLERALSGPDLPRELRMFAGAEFGKARALMGAALAVATKLSLPMEEMIPQLRPVAETFLSVRR